METTKQSDSFCVPWIPGDFCTSLWRHYRALCRLQAESIGNGDAYDAVIASAKAAIDAYAIDQQLYDETNLTEG